MTHLISIRTAPSFTPIESKAAPEKLISGAPEFKTWQQDSARDEHIISGVWEATPGETISIKGELYEFCHILSGVVEITETGGEPRTFRAGDNFVMKPGFTGIWKTIETVRKVYVVVK